MEITINTSRFSCSSIKEKSFQDPILETAGIANRHRLVCYEFNNDISNRELKKDAMIRNIKINPLKIKYLCPSLG